MNINLNPKNLYFGLIGVLVVLGLVSIGGVVMGNKILKEKSGKLMELKLSQEVIDRQKQDIITAKANLEKYEELQQIAEQIVPQDKDQARTVREIINFAKAGTIDIESISFPESSLGKKAAPAAKPAGDNKEASSSSAPAAPPVTQVVPAAGINGVYELEVVVTSKINTAAFPTLINFLEDLESNRRTSQVSGMVITPNKLNRDQLSFRINLKVYIKP